MTKTIFIYSAAIAASAFALQWLDYQYSIRIFSTELYVVVIAVGFAALGIWIGHRLTSGTPAPPFEKNRRAIRYLRISDREYQVLQLLAEGHSNKEIADRLFVSANTVKTHLASLYSKLDVGRRTQAVQKARSLKIIL